jgi:glycine dehydrogenase subunit 1
MAVTAAIQLGWLGTSGLVEMARRCAQATKYARDALLALDRIDAFADAPVVREFAIRLPIPAEVAVERMADAGFLAGIPLGADFDDGDYGLLVSVTERRTREEIDAYVTAMAKAVSS